MGNVIRRVKSAWLLDDLAPSPVSAFGSAQGSTLPGYKRQQTTRGFVLEILRAWGCSHLHREGDDGYRKSSASAFQNKLLHEVLVDTSRVLPGSHI